jgi:hypothetical protein
MPTPIPLAGKYVDDFKEIMQGTEAGKEIGRVKNQFNMSMSMPTKDLAGAGFNAVEQGLNVMQQGINNPLVSMVTGQPLTFEDESGRVSVGPGGIFQAQQSKPGGWGGTIDVPNRSVSLNKGMFDVSAGMGPTYMPDKTIRIGFDSRRTNVPQMVMQQAEGPLMQRQPSAGELERDQVIDQYKASDPFWYRVGTGVR